MVIILNEIVLGISYISYELIMFHLKLSHNFKWDWHVIVF